MKNFLKDSVPQLTVHVFGFLDFVFYLTYIPKTENNLEQVSVMLPWFLEFKIDDQLNDWLLEAQRRRNQPLLSIIKKAIEEVENNKMVDNMLRENGQLIY